MSKTIQELENDLVYARNDAQMDFRCDPRDSSRELDKICAAQEKLTAQKYEAIIEERVQETIKQRLERPQPGDAVHKAWMALEARRTEIVFALQCAVEELDDERESYAVSQIVAAVKLLRGV